MDRLDVARAADEAPLWRVDIAGSWWARLRGLIGRSSLATDEGLFFPGTNSIHMLFMRFAIDCVFVGKARTDGAREVVAVRADLKPWTGVVWWVRGAHGALELPAGSAARARLRVGDVLRFLSADARTADGSVGRTSEEGQQQTTNSSQGQQYEGQPAK